MFTNSVYHQLLYFYFQDYIFQLPEAERSKFTQRRFFGKLRSCLLTIALAIKNRNSSNPTSLHQALANKKWVFVFGKNNYESTRFLADADFVFVSDSTRKYKADHPIVLLPIKRRLKNYFKFFSLLKYLRSKEGERASQISDTIFSSLGWMEGFHEVIKTYQPKMIVFSNDHSYVPRSLFLAAKASGIPTVYIQHASISSYLPPLDFDLSLLEGDDALEKYKRKGVRGRVELIGIPRFDPFLIRKRKEPSSKIKSIGIAFNTVDSLHKIASLINAVMLAIPEITVIVRSHPKENRDVKESLTNDSPGLIYSDSRSESPFDFILRCDLLIAGDSSIHLEAKMLNVDSVYLDLSEAGSTYDLYGYIKKGLIKELPGNEALVEYIQTYPALRTGNRVAQFYNAALGSEFEGKSARFAREKIDNFLKGER
jgi:hypothetical protein